MVRNMSGQSGSPSPLGRTEHKPAGSGVSRAQAQGDTAAVFSRAHQRWEGSPASALPWLRFWLGLRQELPSLKRRRRVGTA